MGFAAFSGKYNDTPTFKKWFEPIESGITLLRSEMANGNHLANYRLRRLQHLLVDLVLLLDAQQLETAGNKRFKVDAAHDCSCDKCPGVTVAETTSVSPPSKLPEP
jgi:hypothetical protein